MPPEQRQHTVKNKVTFLIVCNNNIQCSNKVVNKLKSVLICKKPYSGDHKETKWMFNFLQCNALNILNS